MDQKAFPEQQQELPGYENKMHPRPQDEDSQYKGSSKLDNAVAIITGGDSGIGKAVAIAFAKEGADIVISYLCEDEDAKTVQQRIEQLGRRCLLIPGDIASSDHCQHIVNKTMEKFGKIDILVNHAGEQEQTDSLSEISDEKLDHIFKVNVYSMFYLTRSALKHMINGGVIINTVSIVAYQGNPILLDYTATKSACVGLTRALSKALVKKGIRVNAVAPGPIWTPLIPASFSPEKVATFGQNSPMGRAGQPYEVAPAYVFLASNRDSSYITGQVIHVNGGTMVNT